MFLLLETDYFHLWFLENNVIFHIIDKIKVLRILLWIDHFPLLNGDWRLVKILKKCLSKVHWLEKSWKCEFF